MNGFIESKPNDVRVYVDVPVHYIGRSAHGSLSAQYEVRSGQIGTFNFTGIKKRMLVWQH
jgi:hypothetical protein